MMCVQRPARGRQGFTLLEILVALAISALIITSVVGSLDYTQKAVDAIHNVIETETAGPRILDLIRQDLGRLAVYDAGNFAVLKGANESIRGADADWIDMIVYRRSTRGHLDFNLNVEKYAPVNEVGYRLRMNPESSDFMELYRREDFFTDAEPYKGGTYTLLYDRITNFDVIYFERPEIDPNWEEEWDSALEEALPYALEVRLELEIQPRRSMESLGILGSNRARLEFGDLITVPEEMRWVFRQRLGPKIPEPDDVDRGPGGVAGQDGDLPDGADTGGGAGGGAGNARGAGDRPGGTTGGRGG